MGVHKLLWNSGRQTLRANVEVGLLQLEVSNGLVGDNDFGAALAGRNSNNPNLFALWTTINCRSHVQIHDARAKR